MIQSPLNYTGGKYKLLPQILPLFPKDINCFVDLFCGGCNVGINVCAKKYVYNDSCEPLINLYSVMQTLDSASFIEKIETVIKRYGLSDVKLYGYDFYNCNSSDGLGVYNRDKYMKLRADFNALKERNVDYYVMLYVLMINLLKHWKEIKISQQPFKLKIWNGFKRIVLCFKVLLSNLI